MIWVQLALALLKTISAWLTWARERELISEGMDQEIAKESAGILAKTEYAKHAREKIAAMDDAAVDAALRGLEPRVQPPKAPGH